MGRGLQVMYRGAYGISSAAAAAAAAAAALDLTHRVLADDLTHCGLRKLIPKRPPCMFEFHLRTTMIYPDRLWTDRRQLEKEEGEQRAFFRTQSQPLGCEPAATA